MVGDGNGALISVTFKSLIFIAATINGNYDECPLDEHISAGWHATLALSELREEEGEETVGAAMLLWREEACDLLDGSPDLLDETVMAIKRECLQAVALPFGSEDDFIAAARRAWFGDRKPSLISLAWDTPTGGAFVITDGHFRLTAQHSGYGEPGDIEVDCGRRGFGGG